MKTKVTIKTRKVGANFGVEADVFMGRRKVHTTRTVPHTMPWVAHQAAADWAAARGYEVRS